MNRKFFSRRFSRLYLWIGIAIIFLAALRIAAPVVIKIKINKELSNSTEWSGHINDLDLHLFKAGVALKDGWIQREPEEDIIATFREIKVSLSWFALLKKEVRITSSIFKPTLGVVINGVSKKKKEMSPAEPKVSAPEKLEEVKEKVETGWPFFLDLLEIIDLEFSLEDKSIKELPVFRLHEFNLTAENIWNRPEKQDGPSNISFTSTTSGRGHLEGKIWLVAFSPSPIIRGQIQLKSLDLKVLNRFFDDKANFTLKDGEASLYLEFASEKWKLDGYMKPLLSNLNFIEDKTKKSQSFWRGVWERLLQWSANILENDDSKKIATKIPFSGRLDEPSTNPWTAAANILRNAFLEALQAKFDRNLKIQPKFP